MSETEKLSWKTWLKAAGIRAVKTFAQTLLATIPVGISVVEVEWFTCLGIAALAAILSLLTSLAGLPEAESPMGLESWK